MTDRAELRRLVLQLERDVSARAHLRSLLLAADTTLAIDRRDLRNFKARLGRKSAGPGQGK
jgi:hypothetical protein